MGKTLLIDAHAGSAGQKKGRGDLFFEPDRLQGAPAAAAVPGEGPVNRQILHCREIKAPEEAHDRPVRADGGAGVPCQEVFGVREERRPVEGAAAVRGVDEAGLNGLSVILLPVVVHLREEAPEPVLRGKDPAGDHDVRRLIRKILRRLPGLAAVIRAGDAQGGAAHAVGLLVKDGFVSLRLHESVEGDELPGGQLRNVAGVGGPAAVGGKVLRRGGRHGDHLIRLRVPAHRLRGAVRVVHAPVPAGAEIDGAVGQETGAGEVIPGFARGRRFGTQDTPEGRDGKTHDARSFSCFRSRRRRRRRSGSGDGHGPPSLRGERCCRAR